MKPKPLSQLEQAVMNIVWEQRQCSIREVRDKLNKRLAYTTVATILTRLAEKGLVTYKKSKGVTLFYYPKLTKEVYSKTIAKSFIDKFFSSFGDVAIASFAQSLEALPQKKKEYLMKLLDTYDKTK